MILHAFLRLLDMQPSPIVPIFIDADGLLYKQDIDHGNIITGFIPIENNNPLKIILHSSTGKTQKNCGDQAIYAIEYREKQVRFGNKSLISMAVSELNRAGVFAKSPFTLLEFAKFIQAQDLIDVALRECKSSLQNVSADLFEKWLDGSDLEESQKRHLAPKEDEFDTKDIHLSFSSSYLTLTNLTDFSRNFLHEYRKATFSRAIDELIQDPSPVSNQQEIIDFYNIFLSSLSQFTADDRVQFNFHYDYIVNESRGNVKVSTEKYSLFVKEIRQSATLFRLASRNFSTHHRSLIGSFFLTSRSRQMVLVMYMYYFTRFEAFRNFIKERDFLKSQ
ncbi:MAG: hypothetical protein EOP06_04880 [Proteobacteria bacterium]|nr:MAG: hypothetical protein EOP06_04880 [Pseudomonadota bacterium]